jgi:hypothetical protein
MDEEGAAAARSHGSSRGPGTGRRGQLAEASVGLRDWGFRGTPYPAPVRLDCGIAVTSVIVGSRVSPGWGTLMTHNDAGRVHFALVMDGPPFCLSTRLPGMTRRCSARAQVRPTAGDETAAGVIRALALSAWR